MGRHGKEQTKAVDSATQSMREQLNSPHSTADSLLTQPIDLRKARPWIKRRFVGWIIGVAVSFWIWLLTPSSPTPAEEVRKALDALRPHASPDESHGDLSTKPLSHQGYLVEEFDKNQQPNQKNWQSLNQLNIDPTFNSDEKDDRDRDDINAFGKSKNE